MYSCISKGGPDLPFELARGLATIYNQLIFPQIISWFYCFLKLIARSVHLTPNLSQHSLLTMQCGHGAGLLKSRVQVLLTQSSFLQRTEAPPRTKRVGMMALFLVVKYWSSLCLSQRRKSEKLPQIPYLARMLQTVMGQWKGKAFCFALGPHSRAENAEGSNFKNLGESDWNPASSFVQLPPHQLRIQWDSPLSGVHLTILLCHPPLVHPRHHGIAPKWEQEHGWYDLPVCYFLGVLEHMAQSKGLHALAMHYSLQWGQW